MNTIIKTIFISTLAINLFACKGDESLKSSAVDVEEIELTQLQQQWMEQSWSEYIVKLTISNQADDLNQLIMKAKSQLSIVTVKLLGQTQLVISLDKKTKYKVVYNALIKNQEVESIQPNFSYSIPKQPSIK